MKGANKVTKKILKEIKKENSYYQKSESFNLIYIVFIIDGGTSCRFLIQVLKEQIIFKFT